MIPDCLVALRKGDPADAAPFDKLYEAAVLHFEPLVKATIHRQHKHGRKVIHARLFSQGIHKKKDHEAAINELHEALLNAVTRSIASLRELSAADLAEKARVSFDGPWNLERFLELKTIKQPKTHKKKWGIYGAIWNAIGKAHVHYMEKLASGCPDDIMAPASSPQAWTAEPGEKRAKLTRVREYDDDDRQLSTDAMAVKCHQHVKDESPSKEHYLPSRYCPDYDFGPGGDDEDEITPEQWRAYANAIRFGDVGVRDEEELEAFTEAGDELFTRDERATLKLLKYRFTQQEVADILGISRYEVRQTQEKLQGRVYRASRMTA